MIFAKAFAKSILAGEHAVIRGGPALVFPLYDFELSVHFIPGPRFYFTFDSEIPMPAQMFFHGVIDRALAQCGRTREDLRGEMRFSSTIPIGAGMGSSAALCVCVGQVFQKLGWIQKDIVFEFCRELEDIFHGTSSGVDIAVCLEGAPIYFQKTEHGASWKRLEIVRNPRLAISSCHSRGITSECVNQVKRLWNTDQAKARAADQLMIASVQQLEHALTQEGRLEVSLDLVEGLQKGRRAFEMWDLISIPLRTHMDELLKNGASAVKPTGSGGGGYVLSYWREPWDGVAESLRQQLLPIRLS